MRNQHVLMVARLAGRPDPLAAGRKRGGRARQAPVWRGAIGWPGGALRASVDGAATSTRSVATSTPDSRCGFRAGRDWN